MHDQLYVLKIKRGEAAVEYGADGYTSISWWIWNDPQRLSKMTATLRNQRTGRIHPN